MLFPGLYFVGEGVVDTFGGVGLGDECGDENCQIATMTTTAATITIRNRNL
jgi:hypothetical protein